MATKTAELLAEALEMTMEMIEDNLERKEDERVLPSTMVSVALPFIKRAAANMERHGKKYTGEQMSIVIENFMVAMRYYEQVTGMRGITSLDLTVPITL